MAASEMIDGGDTPPTPWGESYCRDPDRQVSIPSALGTVAELLVLAIGRKQV